MAAASPLISFAADDYPMKGRMLKTLKIGMVGVEGSLTEKFKAAKEAGFDGIEMNAPGIDIKETNKAIAESGLAVDVDGPVNSGHWDVRHTDPSSSAPRLCEAI